MAKGPQGKEPADGDAGKFRKKGGRRNYRPELGELVTLEPGQSFEGTFQEARRISITDRQTHETKEVMRYTFRDADGKKKAMLSAFQLDLAFEEMFDKEGGMERCQGLNIRIERGEDTRLPGKRTMGNYELSVWEE